MITIRTADESDAEALLEYITALSAERLPTIFRFHTLPTLEEEVAFIRKFTPDTSAFFVAMDGDRVIGNIGLSGDTHPQKSHGTRLGMSVLAPYRNQGIGSRLMDTAIQWCTDHRLRRLELEVLSNNASAQRFYRNKGFVLEGCRTASVNVDGVFVDCHMMALHINPST